MTIEAIEKIIEQGSNKGIKVKIDFRKRSPIVGLFVMSNDYDDLKTKNLWRIVAEPNIPSWQTTSNGSLTRIFNGVEMSKISKLK